MEKGPEKITFFQIAILLLSFYVLLALAVDALVKLPPETQRVLNLADNAICFVFLVDFVIRFRRAESKRAFMKWGWIDLLSSIPFLDMFRWGRAARLVRLLRLLRAIRSFRAIWNVLFENRARGSLGLVGLVTFILIVFCSGGILAVEQGVEGARIHTAEDALWWSFVTITTVGYGDYYPVTFPGRLIATVLMMTGVGLFGTYTAAVAAFFVDDAEDDKRLNARLSALERKIDRLADAVKDRKR